MRELKELLSNITPQGLLENPEEYSEILIILSKLKEAKNRVEENLRKVKFEIPDELREVKFEFRFKVEIKNNENGVKVEVEELKEEKKLSVVSSTPAPQRNFAGRRVLVKFPDGDSYIEFSSGNEASRAIAKFLIRQGLDENEFPWLRRFMSHGNQRDNLRKAKQSLEELGFEIRLEEDE